MTNGSGPASDAAALAALEPPHRIEEVTLENGIRLRIKPVSPMLLRSASAHLEMPKVPVWLNPDKGREEENPNDPEYLRARAQWSIDVAEAGLAVALVLGTEVITPLPAGIVGVEDEQWITDIRDANELVGAPTTLRTEGKGRYLDWLRQYAIVTNSDFFRLSRILTAGFALTEQEVERAVASFRGFAVGPTDNGVPSAGGPVVGDHDRDPGAGAAG